jgi:hypothetical protein
MIKKVEKSLYGKSIFKNFNKTTLMYHNVRNKVIIFAEKTPARLDILNPHPASPDQIKINSVQIKINSVFFSINMTIYGLHS